MSKTVYYPYRPSKRHTRTKKLGKNLMLQLLACILIVVVIIGVKKADFVISNKVVDVFSNEMQKDITVENIFVGATEKVRELRDAFKSVSTQILHDNDTFAFNAPVDSLEQIPVFADSGGITGIQYTVTGDELQVFSAGDGTVTEIGTSDTIGKYIKINHDNDVFTIYGNCSNIYVTPLQKVKKSNILASVAKAESAVFSFEMYKDGKPVDPNDFFIN